MRILVVDDSKSIQKSLSWKLQSMGHEVVGTGSDGNDGIRLYGQLQPELLLLDITMPNMDGRECLKGILAAYPKAKVVMISAIGHPEVANECLKMGAIAFIDKARIMTQEYLEQELRQIVENLKKAAV